jgi:hypothetical protein
VTGNRDIHWLGKQGPWVSQIHSKFRAHLADKTGSARLPGSGRR